MIRRSGFVLADVVLGLALLAIVGGAFAVALTHQQTALLRLGHSRAACRLAENSLACLQGGRPLPHPAESSGRVRCQAVDVASPPPGMAWVQVDAWVDGQHDSLVGLVPATAAKGSP